MLFKKKKKDLEELRDITDDVEESDFVPYACHYDAKTLLTKNGELMQVIRILGKMHAHVDDVDDSGLRTALRKALKKHIPSDAYALWFHTVRREVNCSLPVPEGREDGVLRQLHHAWEKENHFARQYVSEMYVSIVREGQDSDKITVQDFIRGVVPSQDIKWRNRFLDSVFFEINTVTENICGDLHDFGARVLGIYELEGEHYSEVQEFLEKIINLVDRKMPVADIDLAYYLTTGEITFGFNAMEVRRSDGRRRFASILSLKEYKEASLNALDEFLKNPIECIVTQCVDFINPEIALKLYKEQKFLISVSEEPQLSDTFELDHILEGSTGNPIDFGQQQVLIFLIADNMRQLEVYVRRALGYLSSVGLVAIREDIHFEECYWAQLPGNFEFIRRLVPTYTNHVGGFMNVQQYPMGNAKNNRWGDALTVLNTAYKTPYYFNFHDGASGHTMIVGSDTHKLDDVVCFLTTMSLKYRPQIFAIGLSSRYQEFFNGLSAHYLSASEMKSSVLPLNPFLLQRNEKNIVFIYRWLVLLFSSMGVVITDDMKSSIRELLDAEEYKKIDDFLPKFLFSFPLCKEKLLPLIDGQYARLFNSDYPVSLSDVSYYGLGGVAADSVIFSPYISLLLQLIIDIQDERPALVFLEDGLEYLGHTHLARSIPAWLDEMTVRNALVLCTSTTHVTKLDASLVSNFTASVATLLCMGCKHPQHDYAAYGINDKEVAQMKMMNLDENQFFIKKKDATLISGIKLPENFSFISDSYKK